MERLNNYILSPTAISMVSGSSKGTAEYLASLVLSCSNLSRYLDDDEKEKKVIDYFCKRGMKP